VATPDTTTAPPGGKPARSREEYEAAFAGLEAPFAFVDLDALWSNAAEMLARAGGKPIRVASKSVRCRPLLRAILDRDPDFRGLMTFTLAESLWLHGEGFDNLLCAYPTTDRGALAELGTLDAEHPPIVMVDSSAQLDLIDAAAGQRRYPIRVCIELNCAYWLAGGRLKVGARRSPIREPADAAALAREIDRRSGFELAGLMGYESHIAGVPDRPLGKRAQGAAIRWLKRRSAIELAERRAAVVAAVEEVASLPLVNGGGTGSLHTTAREPAVTELTAGSGFYAPTLFDGYDDFALTPAAGFALPVVRKPTPTTATLLGGGYPASGAAGLDRLPQPWLPEGLRLDPLEGAGEVQTPVLGAAAADLEPGDTVLMRHAKAGELCERFTSLHLIQGGELVDELPTYHGEGRKFL
jgi:D-serine deaminase-like pyridoxal phosphate-dependent protein